MSSDKPLSDEEVCDLLNRIAFELRTAKAETKRAQTALTASQANVVLFLAALMKAMDGSNRPNGLVLPELPD